MAEVVSGHPSEDVRVIAADLGISRAEVDRALMETLYPKGLPRGKAIPRPPRSEKPLVHPLYYNAMERTLRGEPLSVWQRHAVAVRMAVAFLTEEPGETWWDGVEEKTLALSVRIIVATWGEVLDGGA